MQLHCYFFTVFSNLHCLTDFLILLVHQFTTYLSWVLLYFLRSTVFLGITVLVIISDYRIRSQIFLMWHRYSLHLSIYKYTYYTWLHVYHKWHNLQQHKLNLNPISCEHKNMLYLCVCLRWNIWIHYNNNSWWRGLYTMFNIVFAHKHIIAL